MGGTFVDFSNLSTVSELVSAGERMVCLQFPGNLGALYCHSFLLSLKSPVLRNVLEDTQQQQDQLCTIPLAGDSDLDVWQLTLGLMYGLEAATVTLDNAQALLLLAHKYDMRCITVEVDRFLMSKDVSAADSRFNKTLTPSTVSSWLTAASKSGLEQQVQLCIDYIVSRDQPVDIDTASLAPAHSNQLLAAMQRKLSHYKKLYSETNSQLTAAVTKANREASRMSLPNSEIVKAAAANNFKETVVKHLVSSTLADYTCPTCHKRWIAESGCRINCCRSPGTFAAREPVAVPLHM